MVLPWGLFSPKILTMCIGLVFTLFFDTAQVSLLRAGWRPGRRCRQQSSIPSNNDVIWKVEISKLGEVKKGNRKGCSSWWDGSKSPENEKSRGKTTAHANALDIKITCWTGFYTFRCRSLDTFPSLQDVHFSFELFGRLSFPSWLCILRSNRFPPWFAPRLIYGCLFEIKYKSVKRKSKVLPAGLWKKFGCMKRSDKMGKSKMSVTYYVVDSNFFLAPSRVKPSTLTRWLIWRMVSSSCSS